MYRRIENLLAARDAGAWQRPSGLLLRLAGAVHAYLATQKMAYAVSPGEIEIAPRRGEAAR